MPPETVPAYLVHVGHWSLPLSLGMIEAHARTWQGGRLGERLSFRHLSSPRPEEAAALPPGLWLFPDYLWSEAPNLAVSMAVKAADPRHVTVHGGPSVPRPEPAGAAFLGAHPHVDVAVRAEGEQTAVELLASLVRAHDAGEDFHDHLEGVAGLSFRDPVTGAARRTAERPRLKTLDDLPSPYLDGTLAAWRDPRIRMAVIETNRGCPYGCTFCDWGAATQQKIHLFGLDRVREEIAWIAEQRIPVLFIADANFGILERDVAIAEHVASLRARHGFPKEVIVSYAKDGSERIAEIVRIMVSAGVVAEGVISIQSTSPEVLRAVRRTNIPTKSYEKLVAAYRREGLAVTTDLMVGLPGSTVASHVADLQWCLDEDLVARCFPTVVLPNSPMGAPEELETHRIRTAGPGIVTATATLSEEELAEVWGLVRMYEIAEKGTLLRYVLRHLQWEHGLPAAGLLHSLACAVQRSPERFPEYLRGLDRNATLSGVLRDGAAFYAAVWRHVREVHGVALGSAADRVVWHLNAAVVPRRGASYPMEVEAPFDVLGYFASGVAPRPGERRVLEAATPPQLFRIDDPEGWATGEVEDANVAVSSGLRLFELDWPGRARAAVASMGGTAAYGWRRRSGGRGNVTS